MLFIYKCPRCFYSTTQTDVRSDNHRCQAHNCGAVMRLEQELTPKMELLPTKQQSLFDPPVKSPIKKEIPKNPKSAPEILNSKKGRIIKAVVDDKLVFEGD